MKDEQYDTSKFKILPQYRDIQNSLIVKPYIVKYYNS